MAVLLTGGAGYIGSHIAVELIERREEVIIADNLSNSSITVIDCIEKITGVRPFFYEIDIADRVALERIFSEHKVESVIHLAGYKAVGESVQKPLDYYNNNLNTTIVLLQTMKKHNCKRIIFSSSATIYGKSDHVPYEETEIELGAINPYGWTKYMNERILMDEAVADEHLSVVVLRYFNPIGAHESGLIGENPKGIPNNLMPYIMQVAAGIRDKLAVYGDDYPTEDGTGVRDYIHVVDLAKGHAAALDFCRKRKGCEVINLGTGQGYSVLDIVRIFEKVNQIKIRYVSAPRREGDIAICYAKTDKAREVLGWQAEKTIEDMCRDSWKWQKNVIGNGTKTP